MAWKKGQSGNPGGRPKAEKEVVEAARAAGPRAVAVLTELLEDPDKRIRIEASKALLDRGFGRPAQSVVHEGTVDQRIGIVFVNYDNTGRPIGPDGELLDMECESNAIGHAASETTQ